jgi:hypothetical protein
MFEITITYVGDYGTVAPMTEGISLNPAEMKYSEMGAEVVRFIQRYDIDAVLALTLRYKDSVEIKFLRNKIPTLGSVTLGDLMCSMVNC